MNSKIAELADCLAKSGLMFEQVIGDEVMVLQEEEEQRIEAEMSSLKNIQKLLDESRVQTKKSREKFFSVCEELINAKRSTEEAESKAKKGTAKDFKKQKEHLEGQYRDSYVG